MVTQNHNMERDRALKLISGIKKHLAGTKVIVLNGASYRPAELIVRLEQRVRLLDAASAARAKAHDAVVASKQDRREIQRLLAQLRAALLVLFDNSSEKLNDFGFVPRSARKPGVEAKAQAVQKSRATKAMRHTMGKRQKTKVHAPSPMPPHISAAPANGAPAGPVNGTPSAKA